MEVIRAKRAGACYGVQRALDMADEVIADGGRAYTLGPLIHNPQVVADLAARGAEAVSSVEEIRWLCPSIVCPQAKRNLTWTTSPFCLERFEPLWPNAIIMKFSV